MSNDQPPQPPEAVVSPPHNRTRTTVLRILALALVIALSVFIYSIRDQAEQFAIYGYPGIFLLAFLAYATVLLPAPGAAVIFTMGAIFNPLLVGLAAGAGAALGEVSGYLVGYSSQGVVERAAFYQYVTRWMGQNGGLTILVLSALPNPAFDLAGLAAGALKMPVRKFLLWCWIGETIKMLIFAYAGEGILGLFE